MVKAGFTDYLRLFAGRKEARKTDTCIEREIKKQKEYKIELYN